jgi:hypothetical protein
MARGLESDSLVKVASFVEKLTIAGVHNPFALARFGTILNQEIELGQLLFT